MHCLDKTTVVTKIEAKYAIIGAVAIIILKTPNLNQADILAQCSI
jgi:hypothetical protein